MSIARFPAESARSRHKSVHPDPEKGISDTVRVWFGDAGWRTFHVAGVVDSPALDVAASFFQAESEARVVAIGSVIGTNADLKRYFHIDSIKLVLLNFNLPPATRVLVTGHFQVAGLMKILVLSSP